MIFLKLQLNYIYSHVNEFSFNCRGTHCIHLIQHNKLTILVLYFFQQIEEETQCHCLKSLFVFSCISQFIKCPRGQETNMQQKVCVSKHKFTYCMILKSWLDTWIMVHQYTVTVNNTQH